MGGWAWEPGRWLVAVAMAQAPLDAPAGEDSAYLLTPDGAFLLAVPRGAGSPSPVVLALPDALGPDRRSKPDLDTLNALGVATLRFQFPSTEAGSKRPDGPPLAQATVRAAARKALGLAPALPLLAGGKSFGGRMASQAQAGRPLPGVRGLVFLLGFPLHPAKKPAAARAEHLARVQVPMLFLQGTRDALAEMPLLVPTLEGLGGRATLVPLDGADHAFHVPARSGRSDGQVLDEALDAMVAWMGDVIG